MHTIQLTAREMAPHHPRLIRGGYENEARSFEMPEKVHGCRIDVKILDPTRNRLESTDALAKVQDPVPFEKHSRFHEKTGKQKICQPRFSQNW